MSRLTDRILVVPAFNPVDLQGGANDGDWVSLGKYREAIAVLFKDAGTAGDDPTVTLEQAQDFAGAGAKALTFTEIFRRQNANIFTVGQRTKVTQAAAATYTDAVSAELEAVWEIPIRASMLDGDNGFHTFRMRVADVGSNAQIGAAFYILGEPRYAQEILPSAIS